MRLSNSKDARGAGKANNLTKSDLDLYKIGFYPDSDSDNASNQRIEIRNSTEELMDIKFNEGYEKGFQVGFGKGLVAMIGQFRKWKKKLGY